MNRRLLTIAAAWLAVATLLPSAASAASPSPSPSTPRTIGVSVPDAPVPVIAGKTSIIQITVVNPGPTPVPVVITGQGVQLLDNGLVQFTGAADPVWGANTKYPTQELVVPAGGLIHPTIEVTIPANITPDLYYIGFVVTPRPSGSGVVLINQVGDFVTVDVPGPRVREVAGQLTVSGVTLGPIQINDHLDGQLLVRNVGPSAVQFYGENDVTSAPFGDVPDQHRFNKSLLPIGRSRVLSLSGQPTFPIAMVTFTVTIAYPGLTETSTQQIVLTRSVLVISPWVPGALIALLAGLLIWRVYRVVNRRRMRSKTKRPNARAR